MDTIFSGSDGMAGGTYDDEVTEAQIALLKDSFAHLDLDGWTPCGPPGWDLPGNAVDVPVRGAIGNDGLFLPQTPAGHPFIGMEKDYGFAPANATPPRTLTVVVDGELLRLGPIHREWWSNGKRHFLREMVEV